MQSGSHFLKIRQEFYKEDEILKTMKLMYKIRLSKKVKKFYDMNSNTKCPVRLQGCLNMTNQDSFDKVKSSR